MNTTGHIILIIVTFLSLQGCRKNGSDDLTDWDVDIYTPAEAGTFTIKGHDGAASTIVTVSNPWQGADNVESALFIARDGENVPEGFDGQVIRGNARRIVAMSSSYIAMLDAVECVDRIVGVSGAHFITNPYIAAHLDTIADVGYDGNINYEALVAMKPDLVLIYGVGAPSAMEPKLKELGIPYLYVGDYLENTPLGKAEWVVALAELTGERDKGVEIFNNVSERYETLKAMFSDKDMERPGVMLNTPYAGSWFMPSSTSYMAQLINDAGGDYLYHRDTGNNSLPIDTEQAVLLTEQADVWLNLGSINSLDALARACPRMTSAPCFVSGNIYNNTLRATDGGGNDFFESSIVHPDLVLRDLIMILHPGTIEAPFTYYVKLD